MYLKMNSKNAPMAPVFYSRFWSSLPTWINPLGRSFYEKEVIPFGLYLDDDVDLGGPDIVYEGTQVDVIALAAIRTLITMIFILFIFPVVVIKVIAKYYNTVRQ